jgi:alkylhydroperoxidase/carboxymuconolactone decarboxylase family protein YurZ
VRAHEEKLRRITMNDTDRVLRLPLVTLDTKTRAMLDLAVLIALDGPGTAFEMTAGVAIAAGATEDELVEILIAAAPLVGTAHVVAAAPKLALAIGYDVEAALERPTLVGQAPDDMLH